MRRCVVIATLRCGPLMPPRLLDEANSWRMLEAQAADECAALRTLNWSRERDAQVTDEEAAQLRRPVGSGLTAGEDRARIQRMLRLAMGRLS